VLKKLTSKTHRRVKQGIAAKLSALPHLPKNTYFCSAIKHETELNEKYVFFLAKLGCGFALPLPFLPTCLHAGSGLVFGGRLARARSRDGLEH